MTWVSSAVSRNRSSTKVPLLWLRIVTSDKLCVKSLWLRHVCTSQGGEGWIKLKSCTLKGHLMERNLELRRNVMTALGVSCNGSYTNHVRASVVFRCVFFCAGLCCVPDLYLRIWWRRWRIEDRRLFQPVPDKRKLCKIWSQIRDILWRKDTGGANNLNPNKGIFQLYKNILWLDL